MYIAYVYKGEDFDAMGFLSGEGVNSNLRWRSARTIPNNRFIVPIIDDDVPEDTEVFEVWVECEERENCYLPRTKYTVTILDDDGTYIHVSTDSSLDIFLVIKI